MKTPLKESSGDVRAMFMAALLGDLEPSFRKETMTELRALLRLTPRKMALMMMRELNPLEDIGEEQEAVLRGVSIKTLQKKKKDGEISPPTKD